MPNNTWRIFVVKHFRRRFSRPASHDLFNNNSVQTELDRKLDNGSPAPGLLPDRASSIEVLSFHPPPTVARNARTIASGIDSVI